MSKKERIIQLKAQIELCQAEINKLNQELLDENLSGVTDPVERFKTWANSDTEKVHHCWIHNCEAPSRGRKKVRNAGTKWETAEDITPDLFEYELVLYWERHQTWSVSQIAKELLRQYEKACSHPEGKLFNYSKEEEPYDKEDILYWMKTLMEENFGSCIMDW
jgi:hypothetical protein